MNAASRLFWKVVFWWKKRTGFVDLGQDIEVTGVVMWSDFGKNPDGDFTMHVKLDPQYERYIRLGDRLTSADEAFPATLHCELAPWVEVKGVEGLKVGDRVRVKGRWGFDGVHTGHSEFVEVLYALVRHQPNMKDGWFEIHPIAELEII